jgi:Glycosyl transferase family 2
VGGASSRWPEDVARAVTALRAHHGHLDYEVLLVEDGAGEPTGRACEDLAGGDERVRVLHLDPARRHRHRGYHDTDPVERDRASKRNYDRFLARWRDRTDLLTHGFRGQHRHR